MNKTLHISTICNGIFAVILITIRILNVFLVHPIPGIIYLLLSFIYLPPTNDLLRKRFGFQISPVIKIFLGVVLIMFTLGVSDL